MRWPIILLFLPVFCFGQYRPPERTNLNTNGVGYGVRGHWETDTGEPDTPFAPNADGKVDLWWDFSDDNNLTLVGDNVTACNDLSANDYDMTGYSPYPQDGAGYVAFPVGAYGDNLAYTTAGTAKTIYLVMKSNEITLAVYQYLLDYGFSFEISSAIGGTLFYINDGLNSLTRTATTDLTIHTIVLNGASSSYQLNNSSAATGAFTNPSFGGFGLNANTDADFYMYELIIRDGADDATMQTNIKEYLADKHGISL